MGESGASLLAGCSMVHFGCQRLHNRGVYQHSPGARAAEPFRQSPLTANKAERLGIITVAPLRVTRCLFLKSLSVRVTVSRVDPRQAAICSWVSGTLI